MIYNRYNFRKENDRYVLYYEDEIFKTTTGKTVTSLSPYVAADVEHYLNFPDIPESQGYPPSYYDKLILNSDEYNFLNGRKAEALLKIGKNNEALETVEKAIKEFPKDSYLYFIKCRVNFHMKRYKNAIFDISKAIEYVAYDKDALEWFDKLNDKKLITLFHIGEEM